MEQLRPYTYDDLLTMPEDATRREIINGELVVSPSPHFVHQFLVLRAARILEDAGVGNGVVLAAPMDVRLTAHDVVQPDVMFIRNERLGILAEDGRIAGAPDIVIEVISPGSASTDRVRKFALYARSGVPEYWLLDYLARSLSMFWLENGHFQPIRPDSHGVFRSHVLPDLAVTATDLFAGIPSLE